MKERPIIFSGEMVRAILEGRKTQTRRVVRPKLRVSADGADLELHQVCPYGQTGDRLWVRETYVGESWEDEPKPPKDRPLFHHVPEPRNEFDNEYWVWPHYKATDPAPDLCYEDSEEPACRWVPSIHMPRWASRITLEIVSISIQHVQDISEADAKLEGIHGHTINVGSHSNPVEEYPAFPEKDGGFSTARQAYEALWDHINSKRGYPWDSNPWVWVIEFKVVSNGT